MYNHNSPTRVLVLDIPSKMDIYGLPAAIIDEEFLRALFNDYNVMNDYSSVVINSRIDAYGQPDSHEFITFETREMALKAINELNYTKLDNVPIRLSLDDDETRRILMEGNTYVLVQNLDPDVEISMVHDAFANFGDIISCEIPTIEGKRQGYAYIIYRNVEDAKQAIKDLKDASINGRLVSLQLFNPFELPPS